MYSYLFFGLTMVGIFSIFENLKGGRQLTYFKKHIIVFLILISLASGFDFMSELGIDYFSLKTLIRILGVITFANIYYLVASRKIPKFFIYIELLIILIYLVAVFYGFTYVSVNKGRFIYEVTILNKLLFIVTAGILIISAFYNLTIILKQTDKNNLYQLQIRKWSTFLFVSIITCIFLIILVILLYYKKVSSEYIDTRPILILLRFLLILFILYRPKFIDEAGYKKKLSFEISPKGAISLSNFEFLFYGNQYFLRTEANLEDFALKLNYSKEEVNDFVKKQFESSFNELVNKNRISYFIELLKGKQHESFTIEALSEMSGFSNRQSMYNAFKKYQGSSPSEYISNL